MANYSSCNVVLFLFLFVSSHLILPTSALNIPDSDKLAFDNIYQFGDSISDTGNLVLENPTSGHYFGSFPYGVTYGHPTGRCSDGKLIIDYFADFFHIPRLSPYLHKQANFSQGVNFAVAGSTALDTPTLNARNIVSPVTNSSLATQLNWFKSHLESTCGNHCQRKLQKSVFFVETGGNDYNYAFLQGKTMQEVRDMVPEVVGYIKEAVKQLIHLGANRIVVPGNFPIGCLPIYLSTFATKDATQYDDLKCLKGLNKFAEYHNYVLKQALQEVRNEYPQNVAVVYAGYYKYLKRILIRAEDYGFEKENVHKACCGSRNNSYNFDLMNMCGSKGASVCEDPSRYVSWDGIHQSQRTYMRMAQSMLTEVVPQLVQVV